MMRINRNRVLLAAAVLALAAAAAAFALTKGPFAPIQVTLAEAKRATLKLSAFGIGTVEARLAYAVGPTQAGRVLKVHVDHGDRVAAGQLLAELDPVDLAERIGGGDSALARARETVRAAEAQMREAASRHKIARANADRYRELAQKGFVSKELAENRQNEADVTRAATDAAQASHAAAQRDVERFARERDALAKQLGNLRLVAPAAGIVVARLAEPGTTVVAGQAVVRLVDPNSIWVRARVDQARAGGVQVGHAAEIVLRSAQRTRLAARVTRVEIQSDAVTEERIVNVEFAENPALLSIGELAEITVRLPDLKDALVVPGTALKRTGQGQGVWRIENGRARFHAARIGAQSLDGETEVLEGLAPGDAVIVHSSAPLSEGARVRATGP